MKTNNQENIKTQHSRCKCEQKLKKKLIQLDQKINRVELEIDKLHKLNQKRTFEEKQNRIYEQINLLDLEISVQKISKQKLGDGENFKLTNQIILSQFEYFHDEILEMKGRVSCIAGIQENLDRQVVLTKGIIERQNECLRTVEGMRFELEEVQERVEVEEERSRVSETRISWIIQYLQKCGYKYINKVKSLV